MVRNVAAQARPPRSAAIKNGAIDGVVSTQGGTIQLGGAAVVVLNPSDVQVVTQISEGYGHYHIADLAPGAYRVSVTLDGFATKIVPVVVAAGETLRLDVDLAIASISASVTVVAPVNVV